MKILQLFMILGLIGLSFAAAPVAENVTLSSELGTNLTSEDLTVSYDLYDADSDPLTAIADWRLGGVSIAKLNLAFDTNVTGDNSETRDYSTSGTDGILGLNQSIHHLTNRDPDWYGGSDCISGGCYLFNSSNEAIFVKWPHHNIAYGPFTLEAWVKPMYTGGWKGIAGFGDLQTAISIYNGHLNIYPGGGSGDTLITEGVWHHVAVTRDGAGGVTFYLDGQPDGTSTYSAGLYAAPLYIGHTSWLGESFFGYIDSFRLYDTELSAEQIAVIYNNRTPNYDRLVSQETEVDDVWQTCVTPNDGEQDGSTDCSESLTVAGEVNDPPVVEDVVLSSTYGTNYTDENLTLSWYSYDPEGQPVHDFIAWNKDGQPFEKLYLPLEGTIDSTNYIKDYSNVGTSVVDQCSLCEFPDTGGHDGSGAFQCNGVGFIDTNTYPNHQTGSVSAWFRDASGGQFWDYGTIIGAYPSRIYAMIRNSDESLFWGFDDTMHSVSGTAGLNDNQWHHVALTWGDRTGYARLYLDGVEVDTIIDDGYHPFSQDFYLCTYNNNGGPNALRVFMGYLDEVRVYDHTLSPEQVVALYNGQPESICSSMTGCGDSWQACVTPYDGELDGVKVCSNELTALGLPNDPPTATITELSSTYGTNTPEEDLTVYWSTYDPEGADVASVNNWLQNGQSMTVLNMPFEANSCEEWTWTKDYSGYGNDGDNSAGLLWLESSDRDGSGAISNPVGALVHINVSDSASLNPPEDMTIEVWIKPGANSGTRILVSKGLGGLCDYDLRFNDLKPRFSFRNGTWADNLLDSTNAISAGVWHHVVATQEGNTVKLYVDGVLDATGTTLNRRPDTAGELRIGNYYGGGNFAFMGETDLVRIYDRALSAEQIASLHSRGFDRIVSQETVLDDVWQACVTPNDHEEDGSTVCASISLAESDTDGDGVPNNEDACPDTYGKPEWQGCPFGDFNQVDLHIIDMAKRGDCGTDGSCKFPIEGAEVRVYDRNDPGFQGNWTKNPDGTLYGDVFELDVGRVGRCLTGSDGTCIAGEESTGDYLVIVKYLEPETNKTIYTGLPKGLDDFDNGLASKYFQVIKVIKKDGSIEFKGGKKTVVTGSLLEIVSPVATIWDGDDEIYPFIFTSDSGWTVDLCLEVPQGYDITGIYDEDGNLLSSDSCQQTFVSGESKVVAFQVVDLESPPPHAKAKIKAVGPSGKAHVLTMDIPGKMMGAEKAADKGQGDKQGIPFNLPIFIGLALLLVVSIFFLTRRK